MKMIAESEKLKPRRFIIKHDEAAGFYLYVFENNRCIRDHLQDTLELAIEVAFEDYQVPKDLWKIVEDANQ